jgi:NTE family protein
MITTGVPVDPARIGISYSGGGPLLAIELGIARAFVQSGIKPAVITGASAGAIAGAAHALDMHTGQGIDLAIDELGRMSNAMLKLDPGSFALRVIHEGIGLKAVGDNTPAAEVISRVIARLLHVSDLTIGAFGQPLIANGEPSPVLQVVATDIVAEDAYWFPDDGQLLDALVATSAIPGIFPWRTRATPTGNVILVDGGVVENQPLRRLMDLGCGRIYACVVGGTPGPTEPSNLIDNITRAMNVSMHACTKLEEAYLRSEMPPGCIVVHIHPEVQTPLPDFNFTPDLVKRAVDEACQLTLDWLATNPTT